MSMLEQLYIEVKDIKGDIRELRNDVKDMKQWQERMESKVDSIEQHLIELDSKNANRHIEIKDEVQDMKKNLTAVEIVTSKN